MRQFISLILLLFTFAAMLSQAADTEQGPMIWHGFFKKTELNDTFSWWTEAQLRFDPEIGEQAQTLVRTGLLVPLKKSRRNAELGLLYAFIQTGDVEEFRLTFQHSQNYGGRFDSLSHRIRYELRTTQDSGSLSDRIRYLVRHQSSKEGSFGKFVVWNEAFVNIEAQANDDIPRFDQNRLFVGLRKRFKNVSLEYGYLNQYIPREVGSTVENTLVAYLFF